MLELVSGFEERICPMDKNGDQLWSRYVETDLRITSVRGFGYGMDITNRLTVMTSKRKFIFYNPIFSLLQTQIKSRRERGMRKWGRRR
jgi:hypothetical protein